jgi:putative membrane protein
MRVAWTMQAALVGATLPGLARAQGRDWNGWSTPPAVGMWGLWGIWSLLMLLVMLVFWGLVIAGLVVGLRWLVGLAREGRGDRPDAALDILRQRYARGEISREEFEAKRRDLR